MLEDEAREETTRLCSVWENEYFANEPFVVGYKDTSPVRSVDEDVSLSIKH